MQKLLESGVDPRDELIQSLEEEVRDLKRKNSSLASEIQQEHARCARSIIMLREVLTPLYKGLQIVFGEMDKISSDDSPEGSHSNEKWDVIKQRLAPRLREAVDILLLQHSMKRTQLAAALKMDYSNCTKNVISVLLRQGLLVEKNRELSLKQL